MVMACVAGMDGAEPPPLRSSSEHGAAMQRLWRALHDQERTDIPLVESHLLLGNYARPHDDDSQLMLRWSRALAQAIRHHPQNESLSAALDRALRRELEADTAPADSLAAAFLPAPLARHMLVRRAQAAFDRGAFSAYLGYRMLLQEVGDHSLDHDPQRAQRQAVAWDWIWSNPRYSWWPELQPPGPVLAFADLEPKDWHPHQVQAGAVRWQHDHHLLMAIDPLDRVLWQRNLDRRALLWTGAGAALVAQGDRLQRIDEQGQASDLLVPPDISVIGIRGGFIWLRGAEYHYRLAINADPDDYQRFRLPAASIGPPIVRGDASMWLTDHECILVRDGTIVGRYLHGLAVDDSWSLQQGQLQIHDQSRPRKAIVITDGYDQQYLLQPFPTSTQALLLPGHLNRALRYQQALDAWQALEPEQRRMASDELARSLIALGPDSGWNLDQAWQWIEDPAWRLRVLWRFATPRALSHSSWRSSAQLAHADTLQSLLTVINQQQVLLPVGVPDLPLHPSSTWDFVMSNRGLRQSLQLKAPDQRMVPQLPELLRRGSSPLQAPRPHALTQAAGSIQRRQDAQGNTQRLLDGQLLRVQSDNESTSVALHQSDEAASPLLWRHRWQAPGYLPGRSLDIHGDWLLVAEGQARLHVLHRRNGVRVRAARVPNGLAMPSQARYLSDGTLAILHPISVNTQLTLVEADDRPRTINLPQPALWSVAVDDRLLVALSSDTIRVYPDGVSFTWPGELPQRAPQVLDIGLAADGMLWPWRTDHDSE